jgi:hypothetical protein
VRADTERGKKVAGAPFRDGAGIGQIAESVGLLTTRSSKSSDGRRRERVETRRVAKDAYLAGMTRRKTELAARPTAGIRGVTALTP